MEDHLGVGGRLEDRALAHQFAAQRQAVGEIAVVGDGEAAGVQLGEQRLDVAQDGLAGGRIADMADGRHAGQPVDHLAAGEGVADQAEVAFGMEALAVEGDDAGGLLAAMLQRVQAERGDGGGVGMAENAEDAAFLAQPVVVEIDIAASVQDAFREAFERPCPSCLLRPVTETRLLRSIICRISARSDRA